MTHLRQLCCLILLLLGAVASGLRADPLAPVDPAQVRVISQTVGSDELLLAIAEPSQIVALSHISRDARYSAVSAEAENYPQLSPTCDAESLLALKPSLILCADYSRAELVSQLRKAGLRVIIFNRYATLNDSYDNLRLLARSLGPVAELKAEALIKKCESRVAALAKKLADHPKVRVIAPSVYGMVPGDKTTFQDLCDHAGAENLAFTMGGLHGHVPPPSERMLGWPIDQLVLGGSSLEQSLAPFKSLAPYHFMPSVKEARAVLVPPFILSCLSHYRVDGYEILARALHPDLFPPETSSTLKP